jgi:YD repeat-containing protein
MQTATGAKKAQRTMTYDDATRRLTITDPTAKQQVTQYVIEEFDADFGRAFSVIKLDAAGNAAERYSCNIHPEHESCSCVAGLLERKRCRHAAALIALDSMGRL